MFVIRDYQIYNNCRKGNLVFDPINKDTWFWIAWGKANKRCLGSFIFMLF